MIIPLKQQLRRKLHQKDRHRADHQEDYHLTEAYRPGCKCWVAGVCSSTHGVS